MITIYGDIYFLINFCIDYILLKLTGEIAGKGKIWRTFAASAIGAFFSVFFLAFINMSNSLWSLLALVCANAMLYVAFGKMELRKYLKYLAVFFLLGLIFGGIVFLIFMGGNAVIINGGVYFSSGIRKLILCALFFCSGVKLISVFLNSLIQHRGTYFKVKIFSGDKSITANALLDTGNSLTEPYTGLPVCIICRSLFDKLHTENEKIYIIPYKTISGETNVFTGIMVDFAEITDINGKKHLSRCIVAVTDTVIKKGTEAIISPDMLDLMKNNYENIKN